MNYDYHNNYGHNQQTIIVICYSSFVSFHLCHAIQQLNSYARSELNAIRNWTDNIFGKCIPTAGVDMEDIEK